MKDAQSQKEIKELKETVFKLEQRLINLEHTLDSRTHLVDASMWNYATGNVYAYDHDLRDVLKALLNKLGLEVHTVYQKYTIELQEKEK